MLGDLEQAVADGTFSRVIEAVSAEEGGMMRLCAAPAHGLADRGRGLVTTRGMETTIWQSKTGPKRPTN